MKKLLLFGILLSCLSCELFEEDETIDEEQLILIESSFNATLPEDTNLPDNISFKFSNAYGDYEGSLDDNSGTRSNESNQSTVNSTNVNTPLDGGFQLNYLVSNSDIAVMSSIANLQSSEQEFIINAESTAISALMTHPLLITSFQENYDGIVNAIRSLDVFDAYVVEVSELIKQSIEQSIQLYYTAIPTYKDVIRQLINSTMENEQIPLANGGVELDVQSRNGSTLNYTLTNHYKRTLHIYPKKVWLDSGGFPVNEEAIMDNGFPLIDVMTTDGLNIWETIWKGQFSDPYVKTTSPISVDLGDANQLKLEVYGIGKLHKPFNQLNNEELGKMIMAGLHGGYSDFIKPLFDLFLGVKNFQSATPNDQHFDFRYGSKKEPLRKLCKELTDKFENDPEQVILFRRTPK